MKKLVTIKKHKDGFEPTLPAALFMLVILIELSIAETDIPLCLSIMLKTTLIYFGVVALINIALKAYYYITR